MNGNIPSTHDKVRALVVDDNDDSRFLLETVLESHGIEVYAFSSVHEALDAFDRLKPDVVISDIFMPGENGYSLIRQMRELEGPCGKPTPIIAVTGLFDESEVLTYEFDYVLQKPVDFDALIRQIASLTQNVDVKPTN